MRQHKTSLILGGVFLTLLLSASITLAQDTVARPAGWDEYSHGDNTAPDYTVVFPQAAVNTITITISPDNWQAMQADMTGLFGEFGVGMNRGAMGGFRPPEGDVQPGQAPPGGSPRQPPAEGAPPEGFDANQMPPGGRMGGNFPDGMAGGGDFTDENPIWVTADISFNGQTWTNVGIRYKGNSTLSGAWSNGSLKLGFKLNFDKFEDDYPTVKNQRFYGFDELSFSSNFRDSSYLHEKAAADIFREAGIPAAQTAFYAVYLDYGDDPVYIGLYTAVEAVEDTVIQTQFADDSGNLYKPEGTGAGFQAGTFDEATFSKETNEDAADYSDILALFEALHAETRTTDPAAWRAHLEAILDVDEFIHWLAVNTVIQNWDTYGTMAHNYYLYNDPTTGRFTWIPWDNNEALSSGGRRPGGSSGAFDLTGTGDTWPLISYLLADPVYLERYVYYVEATINGAFAPEKMAATYTALHTLIAPYVLGEASGTADPALESVDTFKNSLNQLIEHASQRYALAQAYVSSQPAGN